MRCSVPDRHTELRYVFQWRRVFRRLERRGQQRILVGQRRDRRRRVLRRRRRGILVDRLGLRHVEQLR
jgi:hypothetical protein